MTQELTGGKVNYYLVNVEVPQREEQPPYQAECEDIIQALGMTFDEGCLFKAIWRTASARINNGKPGQSAKYDAEKMVHYAERILKYGKHDSNKDVTEIIAETWRKTNSIHLHKLNPNTMIKATYANGNEHVGPASNIYWYKVTNWEIVE